jgi:hypothetical protein
MSPTPNDIDEIEDRVWDAINRISTHEAMCEERSKTVFNRLDKIDERLDILNRNMFVASMGLISGMAGVIITLALRF